MKSLAAQLKDISSLMFFARGNNYATALEAALKVGGHHVHYRTAQWQRGTCCY
jgi:glucosamine 6-phosphate synthetase-like amidotransferase/phosphosugar isomerase protein